MKIQDIIHILNVEEVVGDGQDRQITSLHYDSREVRQGSCFFAIEGTLSDGHNFIERAIAAGAQTIVCTRLPDETRSDITYIKVENSEKAMGQIAAAFYGSPSKDLKLVGITGTNGKTTSATLLADMFEIMGYKVGLISTVNYRIAGREIPSTHTTPDSLRLNAMMREMVDEGCEYCFMEVSSHSVVQNRIEGLHFAGAVFSNITHDHLDYHGTFANYIKAKQGLFDRLPREAFALYNADDRNGGIMVQNSKAQSVSYSLRQVADFRARIVEMHFDGMLLDIMGSEVWLRLTGRFNAYNMLVAYSTACLMGFSADETLLALSKLTSVSGRFELLQAPESRSIIIDYAHTPDALKNVLETVAEIGQTSRQELRITTVCGCGGERDKLKRPEMAKIAYENSTTTIFTSDNPRSEDPEQILAEMIGGVEQLPVSQQRKWLKISDRAEAIRTAILLSKPGETIVIAGKGHEKYQIIGSEKRHFDDKEQAIEAIKQYLN